MSIAASCQIAPSGVLQPARRGKKGTAARYFLAEQAEHAYRQQVADWHTNAPSRTRTPAAAP